MYNCSLGQERFLRDQHCVLFLRNQIQRFPNKIAIEVPSSFGNDEYIWETSSSIFREANVSKRNPGHLSTDTLCCGRHGHPYTCTVSVLLYVGNFMPTLMPYNVHIVLFANIKIDGYKCSINLVFAVIKIEGYINVVST